MICGVPSLPPEARNAVLAPEHPPIQPFRKMMDTAGRGFTRVRSASNKRKAGERDLRGGAHA
jgi:hypothetical protein